MSVSGTDHMESEQAVSLAYLSHSVFALRELHHNEQDNGSGVG